MLHCNQDHIWPITTSCHILVLTCRRSSKSRAANFFISDALLAKRRMVELNVGTWRYLEYGFHVSTAMQGGREIIPFVKHVYKLTTWGCSIQDTDKMCEERLPNSQLKFVHEINHKTWMDIEILSQSVNKCILFKFVTWMVRSDLKWLTTVGTDDVGFRRRLTAAPIILAAFLYISTRARRTRSARYWRLFSRVLWSRLSPIWSSFSFSTRHRGHGQVPLSRMVARRTLGMTLL